MPTDSLISIAAETLEMIATGATLEDVLTSLCRAIDAKDDQMISTILLADAEGKHLWPAAGPRAPKTWVDAITPLAIGPNMGSCGTAAFRRERMIVSDIESDPRWSTPPDAHLRAIALAHGLRAAWSEPLISKTGELLGSFGLTFKAPRSPNADELQLIKDAGHRCDPARDHRAHARRRGHSREPDDARLHGIDDGASTCSRIPRADLSSGRHRAGRRAAASGARRHGAVRE